MNSVTVYRGRTKELRVKVNYDISEDTFKSQIRVGTDPLSGLIAEWDIEFETDGKDGALVLTLDNSITANITNTIGYFDVKRTTGGEPVPLWDGDPLQVNFQNHPTV